MSISDLGARINRALCQCADRGFNVLVWEKCHKAKKLAKNTQVHNALNEFLVLTEDVETI